ncbi:hypothetical protein BRARA_B02477 [Brassica rapa]|uniref:Knottins-like domain-containing protein n=1 Tax=Brassica campestris TaxID=3711 RepID=A0A398AC67_BRACM|nr:hypothetical protein BRARA_B02477 [Brassica rapa]
MQLISKFFFLLILLVGPDMKMVQGQQMCEAKSINFKGICLKWRNCKQVCISEGFPNGRCKKFIRKCVCMKPCLLN